MQLKIAKLKNLNRSTFPAEEKTVCIKSLLNLFSVALDFEYIFMLLLVSKLERKPPSWFWWLLSHEKSNGFCIKQKKEITLPL
jgi:hypothetical protein